MPVTERLRAAGNWSLNLREDTPKSILDDLDIATRGFGLLIVTPAKVPSTAMTAALLRGMSRYVGIYRGRPNDYSMQGAHASILLGDEDGKGEIISAAVTQTGASLSTWLTALLPTNGIAKGTVSGGSTLSASYIYMSPRQAIDAVCDGCGADWLVRCNSAGDLVVDASPKATLFGSAAVALATRRALGGKDSAISSLRATQLSTAMDVEDYSTKIWLLARGDGGLTLGTATAGSVPYFGPGGAAIKMERIIDAPNVDPGNETTIATLQLANFSTLRRAITLSTDEYDISGVVRPGQNIYVYDPIINLYDNAVEQYFRGETIHPILLRCFGHTWPIRAGFGVYFQTPEASPRIINLSDWFIPEDGDTTVEVGALSRQVGAGPVTVGHELDATLTQWPASLVTTKGDLLAATASGVLARVGVGANYSALTADSAQASGLNWRGTVVIICTAGTRPASPVTGQLIFETDTGNVMLYTGATWTRIGGSGPWAAYTPTVQGVGWAIGNGTLVGSQQRLGRTQHVSILAIWGSTSTFGAGALNFALPSTPVNNEMPGGCTATIGGNRKGGTSFPIGASLYPGWPQGGATSNLQNTINTVPGTWANGDVLQVNVTYQANAD